LLPLPGAASHAVILSVAKDRGWIHPYQKITVIHAGKCVVQVNP
jgi:hypothetical protein